MAGVIFDGTGKAFQLDHLARQLSCPQGDVDAITYAVRELGFVHIAPIRDALLVKFDPSTVNHLAALAALYEIVGQAPKRLVLAYPGERGGLDRYEIFSNLITGLRRVEAALNSAENAVGPLAPPPESLPADRCCPQPPREQISNRKPPPAISGSCGFAVKAQAGDYSAKTVEAC